MRDNNRSDDWNNAFGANRPGDEPDKAARSGHEPGQEPGQEQGQEQGQEFGRKSGQEFARGEGRELERDREAGRETGPGGPAYFRYGPFASGAGGEVADEGRSRSHQAGAGETGAYDAMVEAASSGHEQSYDVEITPPDPLKPVPQDAAGATIGATIDAGKAGKARKAGKRSAKRQRTSFRSMFAAFIAGAVLVGGLMFASDKLNLFTADAATGGTPPVVQPVQTEVSDGNRGGLQNASLEVVRPNTIAEIVSNSQAAVVKIETYSKGTRQSTSPFFNDPFFRFFFGDDYNQPQQSPEGRLYKTGEGSGFLFDSEGYILTNQHVVDNADEIRVFVQGFEDYFVAEKLGDSYDLDLAALKIEGSAPFAYLRLGDAEAMNVGDWVIAIGNPYGFDHTVTVGVLSAKERPITIREGQNTRQYENLLQTDASINPGNSGGPLLNLNGEVIGINTAVSAQAQGIGFAIPTGTITDVLDNLKNDTPIPKQPEPYIGVYLGNLDDAWKEELGFKGDGALVTQIEVGGPANRAGIRAGDIITEVAGKKISDAQDVSDAVKEQEVGSNIHLKIFRQGKTYEAVVTVGDRNASE